VLIISSIAPVERGGRPGKAISGAAGLIAKMEREDVKSTERDMGGEIENMLLRELGWSLKDP
jgi:hypothetical protein